MRPLEFITVHVNYNPAYTHKFQMKTTLIAFHSEQQFVGRYICQTHCSVTGLDNFSLELQNTSRANMVKENNEANP